jgi:sugar phosphate isomerase/epimerase
MISLSTSWFAHTGLGGREIVERALEMGFRALEVEYRLNVEQVEEIVGEVRRGRIRVASLHNYVPYETGETRNGDRYLLSALSEDERAHAVEKTRGTLKTAAGLGATAVVLHLGKVEVETDPKAILGMIRSGDGDSLEAQALRKIMERERMERAPRYLNRVIRSVRELQTTARELGICLGLENRYYYHEIPDPEEIDALLAATDPKVAYYWHDVGHGQVMENMGMKRHEEHLERAQGRLLGIHFHDIIGLDDHIAPGTGVFDFERIRPWWKPDLLSVMELRPSVPEEDVVRGREFLEGRGFGMKE